VPSNEVFLTMNVLNLEPVKKRIAELEAEVERLKEERRWIPVTERLPENNRPVLMKKPSRILSGLYESGGWWDDTYLIPGVTHWMERPPDPPGC